MNKKKVALIVAAGLVPILILGGLALFVFLRLRPVEPPEVPQRFWAASFSPDGKWLATVGGENDPREQPRVGELGIWDAATGARKRLLRQNASLRAVAWSPNGKFIAMGDFNGVTKLVAPGNGKTLAVLPPHLDGVNALAISPDSKLVAIASLDGTITLWEDGGKEWEALRPNGGQILNVAIAPDRHAVVATTRSGNGYLFDLAQPGEPQVLELSSPRRRGAEAVAFAPDGASFVTGCQKTLRLWETATGKLIRELEGSPAEINSAAFAPDGEALATIDSHGTLALWNPATGARMNSIPAHRGTSYCVVFSPDGKRLATVGRNDLLVRIWNSQTLALLASFSRVPARP